MASNKKKKKLRYGSPQQIRPQAMTEQQMRIQKMRDELNAPDPNDPHVFTRYKVLTYPFDVLFPPYALYRIWCKKSEFNKTEKIVQSALCVLIMRYFLRFVLFPVGPQGWYSQNTAPAEHREKFCSIWIFC